MGIIIGTRASTLALAQADWVAKCLKELSPGCEIIIRKINTRGDVLRDISLVKAKGKGFFVKEIEQALKRGAIDIAVHSMKDLPTEIEEGLSIVAVTERIDPRDVILSRSGLGLDQLSPKSKVGTSSLRRQSQLLYHRPDLKLVDMRGNLDTRIKKLKCKDVDAIVVAAAGIQRLGLEKEVTEYISDEVCLPAPGQGSLGLEIREADQRTKEVAQRLDHRDSHLAISAERAFLGELEGGCQVPVACLGTIKNGVLKLVGMVAQLDGKKLIKSQIEGSKEEAVALGKGLAKKVLNLGAGEILAKIKSLKQQ